MTTSFFSGQNMAPEADSTNELIDTLTAQVATVTAANSQAQQASSDAAASAHNASISETNVSTLAQQANTTLATAQTAITTAQAATTTATTAASTATSQAGTATTQANIATTQAGLASTSETNALASAGTATSQAGIATTQAGIATTQAAAALASKNAAGTSEANAGTSASTATTQAGIATTQAGIATTQAGTATTQAGIATTQAGNASTSATAALASQNAAAASALLATNQTAYLAGRNRIINGDCRVQQRASLVASAAITGYGGPDRFVGSNANSAGGQYTQSAYSMTGPDGLVRAAIKQTVNTIAANLASNNFWGGIQQIIEGYNCFDLMGQPASLSFLFETNATGNYSVSLTNAPSTQSFLTTFSAVAGVPKVVKVLIPSLPSNLGVPNSNAQGLIVRIGALNVGTYSGTPNANAWQAGTLICMTGPTNWASTVNNFIGVTDLQLEAGSVATPFERRSYATELVLCQRYYQAHNTWKHWMAATGASQVLGTSLTFPQMRAVPTVAYSSIAYGNASGITFEIVSVNNISYYTTSSATGGVIVTISAPSLSAEL
jgi:hypothetical protein